ncbi:LysR substrate-binding domain-containing protein [Variovorax sp. UC122_21]
MSYPRGTPFGELVRHFFASLDEAPRTMLEVGSPQNACALTHLGAGIALVDEFSLQAWPDARFRILPVEGIEPLVAHLVHLRTDPLSPAAEAFVRTLRSVLMQRGLAAPQAQED